MLKPKDKKAVATKAPAKPSPEKGSEIKREDH